MSRFQILAQLKFENNTTQTRRACSLAIARVLSGGLQESIARCYKVDSIYCVTLRWKVLYHIAILFRV
ncbi:hypothetical protein NDI47_02305 [Microcoleus vaginatus GB1-A2]|uniref:hypothetical protein n=1 Tax=Microcoleus vaginatus TaxID=119532 RepID=UPI0016879A2E|nr:hypothetical protein [Microcoleus sp. FACHB-61]